MKEVQAPVTAIAFILAACSFRWVSGRNQRPDLSPVRAHHRGFGAALGFNALSLSPR